MSVPTRQRLIESALGRFYRDGFRSVGLDQILADVGISKTAFYKHFRCKEDLMLAGLEHQNERLQDNFRTMVQLHGGDTPLGQLHALLDAVESIIESDNFHGCIFVNVTMEFPLPHEPAHQAAAQSKRAIEEFVCQLATECQADDPQELAKELCLIIEGAYVTRHVTDNKHTIEVARSLARLAIEARCPHPTA